MFQNFRRVLKTSKMDSTEPVGVPRYPVLYQTPPNSRDMSIPKKVINYLKNVQNHPTGLVNTL